MSVAPAPVSIATVAPRPAGQKMPTSDEGGFRDALEPRRPVGRHGDEDAAPRPPMTMARTLGMAHALLHPAIQGERQTPIEAEGAAGEDVDGEATAQLEDAEALLTPDTVEEDSDREPDVAPSGPEEDRDSVQVAAPIVPLLAEPQGKPAPQGAAGEMAEDESDAGSDGSVDPKSARAVTATEPRHAATQATPVASVHGAGQSTDTSTPSKADTAPAETRALPQTNTRDGNDAGSNTSGERNRRQPMAEAAKPLPSVTVLSQTTAVAPPQTPAAAVVEAVVQEVETAARTELAQERQQAAGPVRTLKIQLHPAELGVVVAQIRTAGDGVSVEIQTETAEAARRLSADGDTIVQSLRSLGLEVQSVTVQHGQSESRAGAETGQGRSGQQAGASSDGQGGSPRNFGQSMGEDHADQRVTPVDSSAAAGTGRYI